jgi:hypothetical protein
VRPSSALFTVASFPLTALIILNAFCDHSQWNKAFVTFLLVIEFVTEKLKQTKMPLKSILEQKT